MQFDLFGALRLDDLTLGTIDRLAFLRDSAPYRVVLARDGALLSASAPPTERVLRPLRMICADLTGSDGKNMRYIVRSAMHKEVRRGDVPAAVHWARVMQLIDGAAAVRQYARRILFEETRDTALALSWRGQRSLSPEQMIRSVAAAPKKWALSAHRAVSCGAARLLAYPEALRAPPLSPSEIDRLVGASSLALSEAFRLQWRVTLAAEPAVRAHLREALRRRAPPSGDADFAALSAGGEAHLEEVLLERLCGLIDPAAGEAAPDRDDVVDDREVTIPPLRAYIYDPHTSLGRRRLIAHLARIAPSAEMPPGLDLRWSGMARGAAWRASTSAWRAVDWETVEIPEALWAAAALADGLYYGKLYRDAGITGIPFPRGGWQGQGR